jgi:hypothetical protein|nr:MAG TPA: structural protein [Caudoviricetes sp.]
MEQFLTNQTAYGTPEGVPIANLLDGSQLGIGYQAAALDAATPLVFPPASIFVMQTPQMYAELPEMGRMLKVMMECHAKEITGIDFGYTLNVEQSQVGHDSQTMAVPTKAARTGVNPAFTYQELTGNLIWNIHRRWIWDIQNPDTNASMEFMDDEPSPYALSSYAVSFLAVQYDPTAHYSKITDCAFYTNVFPTMTSELGIERRIAQSKIMDRPITYTGYVIHNEATRELGRTIAEAMNIRRAKYLRHAPGVTSIDGKIADAGLQKDIEAILAAETVA